MARPISEMSLEQLTAEIANHERHRRSGKPYSALNKARFQELLEARGQRDGLTFKVSLNAIETAAKAAHFISYGQIAEANGMEWNKARLQIGPHLWDLVVWAHDRGLPMLSAIVVNKQNLSTGQMEPETLAGFVRAAEALGHTVDDREAFLKKQQKRVFEAYRQDLSPDQSRE